MPSTPSSRAISLVVLVVSLYRIADVRDVTDTPLMRARSPIIASIIESAK